jgi:hypothetical protein
MIRLSLLYFLVFQWNCPDFLRNSVLWSICGKMRPSFEQASMMNTALRLNQFYCETGIFSYPDLKESY